MKYKQVIIEPDEEGLYDIPEGSIIIHRRFSKATLKAYLKCLVPQSLNGKVKE